MKHFFALNAFLALSLVPLCAFAKCGTGNPVSYDDIESVLLTDDYRVSDGYRDKSYPATTLPDSTFWVHFWETGPAKFPTSYSQYTLKGSVGMYKLSATLADAKHILEQDNFYSLSPPRYMVTEQTWSILTVQRCAVVTRIVMYNNPEFQEPATAKLFSDLWSLIEKSTKTRTSDKPKRFEETLIFDP